MPALRTACNFRQYRRSLQRHYPGEQRFFCLIFPDPPSFAFVAPSLFALRAFCLCPGQKSLFMPGERSMNAPCNLEPSCGKRTLLCLSRHSRLQTRTAGTGKDCRVKKSFCLDRGQRFHCAARPLREPLIHADPAVRPGMRLGERLRSPACP